MFGKKGSSMEDVVVGAVNSNAPNFINKIPEGYDTQVTINTFLFVSSTRKWLVYHCSYLLYKMVFFTKNLNAWREAKRNSHTDK